MFTDLSFLVCFGCDLGGLLELKIWCSRFHADKDWSTLQVRALGQVQPDSEVSQSLTITVS